MVGSNHVYLETFHRILKEAKIYYQRNNSHYFFKNNFTIVSYTDILASSLHNYNVYNTA